MCRQARPVFSNQGMTYKEEEERSLQFINQEIAEKKIGHV